MQKLHIADDEADEAIVDSGDYIECIEGAKFYLAYVDYGGRLIMCIMDKGKWRPITQQELMGMV